MCNAFYCRVQKSNFINTKVAIFGAKYISQDLTVILRNITLLCQVRQRGVGRKWLALPRQTAGIHEHLPSYNEALTQCCFIVVPTSKTALEQHRVNASCLLSCITAEQQTRVIDTMLA